MNRYSSIHVLFSVVALLACIAHFFCCPTKIYILKSPLHRDTVTRSAAITSCFIMIMHSPMLQGSVHNSWKLKLSPFFHGLHPHQTCRPLSMFGMLWIDVYDGVLHFPPISSNFAQPLKRSGTTFYKPQLTARSTPCEGDVSRCMRQILTGFLIHAPTFFLRYL